VQSTVKPQNVLFDNCMKPFLADLGLATGPSAVPVIYNGLVGTAGFMAPEMLARKPYGKPVDVWSFNRVVHATATGDPHGATDLDAQSVMPWIWSPHICTSHDNPDKRTTAAELHNIVERVLNGGGGYMHEGVYSTSVEAEGILISDVLRSVGPTKQQLLKKGRVRAWSQVNLGCCPVPLASRMFCATCRAC
jgi:serine/threonine protein kinase